MAFQMEPTSGRLALKIKSREDAREFAESLLPLSKEDDKNHLYTAAAQSVLSEVIVTLNLMFPKIWRLRDLALIVSHPIGLRMVLPKTAEGRALLNRYFSPLTPETAHAIIEMLTKSLR